MRAEKRLRELESTVSKLEDRAPPKPRDLVLKHGIYWGLPGDDLDCRELLSGVCSPGRLLAPQSHWARARLAQSRQWAPYGARIQLSEMWMEGPKDDAARGGRQRRVYVIAFIT